MIHRRQRGKARSRAVAETQKPNLKERERALRIRQFYRRHVKRQVHEQRRMRNEEPYWDVFLHHNYNGEDAEEEPGLQEEPVDEPEAIMGNLEDGRQQDSSDSSEETDKSELKSAESEDDDTTSEMKKIGEGADGKVSKSLYSSSEDNDATVEPTEIPLKQKSQEWAEDKELKDQSNSDEVPMKPSNTDVSATKQFGAHPTSEWKTGRAKKEEAVFCFSKWFENLCKEDKEAEAAKEENNLVEMAESIFNRSKQHFRKLILEKELSAEELTLLERFIDMPELAATLVKMRRSLGVPGLKQDVRRCLTCEELLEDMPLRAHTTANCWIPYEHRIVYSKRQFGQRKCFQCGKMKQAGKCNCQGKPCARCWRWDVTGSFPHLQVMGTCQFLWKIREQIGHTPSEEEMTEFTKRDDKLASMVQQKLEKLVTEIEKELIEVGRAGKQKREAALWW
ncbi:hypothetical protein B9Z55_009812 [Caenorhabditis nigoni]|uniref:Uncharacterized protein n=1 Tax=Caenorhabditis nigoni TaxID=1611254 RepID=A0A2G5UTR7_9PELO|nr:hypothetical protein B9Z55_009812 [Caenorhabditis nigoni]